MFKVIVGNIRSFATAWWTPVVVLACEWMFCPFQTFSWLLKHLKLDPVGN